MQTKSPDRSQGYERGVSCGILLKDQVSEAGAPRHIREVVEELVVPLNAEDFVHSGQSSGKQHQRDSQVHDIPSQINVLWSFSQDRWD